MEAVCTGQEKNIGEREYVPSVFMNQTNYRPEATEQIGFEFFIGLLTQLCAPTASCGNTAHSIG